MEKSVEIPGQETHRYLAVHHLLPVPSHRQIAPACNPSPTDGRCASIGISTTNSCSAGDLWLVWPIMQSKGRDYAFEGIIGESTVFQSLFFFFFLRSRFRNIFEWDNYLRPPFSCIEFKSKGTHYFILLLVIRFLQFVFNDSFKTFSPFNFNISYKNLTTINYSITLWLYCISFYKILYVYFIKLFYKLK